MSGILLASLCSSCDAKEPAPVEEPPKPPAPSESSTEATEPATAPAAGTALEAPADPAESPGGTREAYRLANARIEQALANVALPGAPGFEKNRTQLLARAKSEPVFFLEPPKPDPTMSKGVAAQRQFFERTDYSWRTLKDLRKKHEHDKPTMRQLFLSDGYLYSEDPNRAFTLVSLLRPSMLFDEDKLWIQRGQSVFHAVKGDKGEYYFSDGSEQGQRVRLLHLDRIGTGTPPPPLHVDFRDLKYRAFFQRAKVRHIGESQLVADLRYEDSWVRTLLERDGARLSIQAEAIEPERLEKVSVARTRIKRQLLAVTQLRGAMRNAIDEGLPFDEPKAEFGQEDGKLRRLWERAYFAGDSSFRYNDDRYSVFGKEGQPLVPQVCIDFMVDTFQRASGSWFLPEKAKKRERTPGKLDWGVVEPTKLRRTKFFVQYAKEHTDWFDTLNFPEGNRIELGYKDRFFGWLEKRVDDFEAGDIVLIRGYTPWDEEDEHTHSFFVYETDPMSGVPVAIAGNAGPANLWSWETEARRTPNRTLRTRVRPKLEWLESYLTTSPDASLQPPVLVSGKK
jgi:hypothetical protein